MLAEAEKKVQIMPYQMWINGSYTSARSGKVLEVYNPPLKNYRNSPAAEAADIELAVPQLKLLSSLEAHTSR